MSWSSKKLIATVASFLCLTTACGFTPVYQEKTESASLANIEVKTNGGREGQWLKQEIEDTLNPSQLNTYKDFTLNSNIKMEFLPVLVESTGKIHRYRIKMSSQFTLMRNKDQKNMDEGTITRTVSYKVSDSDYSSFVAPQDAIRRGIKEIAREYGTRFAARFAE